MLPFFRRELLIELQTYGCSISRLNRSGQREQGLASGSGRGAQALDTALANLRQLSDRGHRIGYPLPLAARLVVADEYVDYDILPGHRLRWPRPEEARQRAVHRFADRLGHEDSLVEVTPLPESSDWLCAALDREEMSTWQSVLDAHGVRLLHVHPALVEDLRGLAGRIGEHDAVLAFAREEGLMLMRLRHGTPRHLTWMALNPDESAIVELRLRRYARDTVGTACATRTVVYLLSRSRALCRFVLESETEQRPHAPRSAAMAPCAPHRYAA